MHTVRLSAVRGPYTAELSQSVSSGPAQMPRSHRHSRSALSADSDIGSSNGRGLASPEPGSAVSMRTALFGACFGRQCLALGVPLRRFTSLGQCDDEVDDRLSGLRALPQNHAKLGTAASGRRGPEQAPPPALAAAQPDAHRSHQRRTPAAPKVRASAAISFICGVARLPVPHPADSAVRHLFPTSPFDQGRPSALA